MAVLVVPACGGGSARGGTHPPPSERAERSTGTPARAASSGAEREAPPPTLEAALAPLRPEGAEAWLSPIEAHPDDGAAIARAAVAFADTHVGAMTLIYGLDYAAMEPAGAERDAVAAAMVRVLREHISVTTRGTERGIATSLAPGAMPGVALDDGAIRAPVAHLFEILFGQAVAVSWEAGGSWDLASATRAVLTYVELSRSGTPLEPHVEVQPWLRALADAGHLEAFVAELLAPAFAEGAAYVSGHAAEIGAARAFVTNHPFAPTRPVMPDDLVAFTPAS